MVSAVQINRPLLQLGAQGAAVTELQQRLRANFGQQQIHLTVDGVFGEQTLYYVQLFQQRSLLTPDGVVGQATWEALLLAPGAKPTLQSGSQGADVKILQSLLKFDRNFQIFLRQRQEMGFTDHYSPLGYYTGAIDGSFGPQTMAAVTAFQGDQNLVEDGVVGRFTWVRLRELAKLIVAQQLNP